MTHGGHSSMVEHQFVELRVAGSNPVGHPDYGKEANSEEDSYSFNRFQGEFARLYGPQRRGRSLELGSLSPEFDNDTMHQMHLSWEEYYKKIRLQHYKK